jgi:hypothetical protein
MKEQHTQNHKIITSEQLFTSLYPKDGVREWWPSYSMTQEISRSTWRSTRQTTRLIQLRCSSSILTIDGVKCNIPLWRGNDCATEDRMSIA